MRCVAWSLQLAALAAAVRRGGRSSPGPDAQRADDSEGGGADGPVGNSSNALATYLYAADFDAGTYRITKPGRYELFQDVVFEPTGPEVNDMFLPETHSKKYPQYSGYFLGFFAAITVEADNVEIDCQGHAIKMSERFHKHQRFFSVITLGNRPFVAGHELPQFFSNITAPEPFRSPKNVLIQDCVLGLSSNHGIHGNNVHGLMLHNTSIRDFEVAGISLNGASRVVVEHANVGPSLRRTFTSFLSQSIYMDHLANSMLPRHPGIREYMGTAIVKLRGERKTVKEVFVRLRLALRKFLDGGEGPLKEICGDGRSLPDGSAMYGLLLHRTGAAAGEFGACPGQQEDPGQPRVKDVRLKGVRIHDLHLEPDQVTRMLLNGKQVMGPGGDVLPIARLWDANRSFAYVGNPLSDAQLAMGVLKGSVGDNPMGHPLTYNDAMYYFGDTHIPEEVQLWAAGEMTTMETEAWARSLEHGSLRHFECGSDAFGCRMQGLMGLKLGFLEDVVLQDVNISGLNNSGAETAKFCKASPYPGADVHGLVCTRLRNMQETNLHIDDASLTSAHGRKLALDINPE